MDLPGEDPADCEMTRHAWAFGLSPPFPGRTGWLRAAADPLERAAPQAELPTVLGQRDAARLLRR